MQRGKLASWRARAYCRMKLQEYDAAIQDLSVLLSNRDIRPYAADFFHRARCYGPFALLHPLVADVFAF